MPFTYLSTLWSSKDGNMFSNAAQIDNSKDAFRALPDRSSHKPLDQFPNPFDGSLDEFERNRVTQSRSNFCLVLRCKSLSYHRDNRGMFRNACIQRHYHLAWHRILFVDNMVVRVFEQMIIVLSEDWVSDSRLPKSMNFQIAKDFIVRFIGYHPSPPLSCNATWPHIGLQVHLPNYGLLQLFLDLQLDFRLRIVLSRAVTRKIRRICLTPLK
jgi:hypothetical protein